MLLLALAGDTSACCTPVQHRSQKCSAAHRAALIVCPACRLCPCRLHAYNRLLFACPARCSWYRAHDALRADFAALQQMLGCFAAQLGEGRPLTRPQATAAERFFAAFLKFLHHHHHNEDDIAVPYLKTRCQMPEKIAADHAQLDVRAWAGVGAGVGTGH